MGRKKQQCLIPDELIVMPFGSIYFLFLHRVHIKVLPSSSLDNSCTLVGDGFLLLTRVCFCFFSTFPLPISHALNGTDDAVQVPIALFVRLFCSFASSFISAKIQVLDHTG